MENSIFKKLVGSLIIVVCCVVIGFVIMRNVSSQKASDMLVIGMMSGYPPYMSINQAGEYEGFDVDAARELAKRLNKKCEIVDMGSLASLFLSLEKNKIDMIFSGLNITQERRNQMEMIPYTGENVTEYSLMFWDTIPHGITKIEDLKNYPNPVIAVEPGDSAEKFLNQYDFIIKKQIGSLVDQILDVQYGKSVAAFREVDVAKRVQSKNPRIRLLSVPLPLEYQVFGMGIAFKKNNTVLIEQVRSTIKAIRADGTLKKLEKQWKCGGEGYDDL